MVCFPLTVKFWAGSVGPAIRAGLVALGELMTSGFTVAQPGRDLFCFCVDMFCRCLALVGS